MQKIKLIDNSISHNKSLSFNQTPTYFEWDKNFNSKYTFYTDNLLSKVNGERSIAWLIEPIEVCDFSYKFIKDNYKKFDYVLTYCDLGLPNQLFYPFGGCWINEEDCRIHDKTKILSFISSGKMITSGHKLRNEIVNTIQGYDLFGRKYKPMVNKIESLKDYMFQIVIENCKVNDFFTEKIIDCFQTGTIPIYWGTENIGNYFDIDGIIQINDLNDLINIIPNLNYELYFSKIESIKNNFEISKKYKIPEDWIYNNHKFLF